jgi:hypothetical protein
MAQMMFSKGWDFVRSVKPKEPLKPKYVHNALTKANVEFNFKKYFIKAEEKARALHKCLFIKWQLSRPGQRRKYRPRVAVILENEVDYDDAGHPEKYHPFIKQGKTWKQFHFTPKEAFLWIHDEDPLGNMYQGRSVLIPVYWTIRRMENMIDAYTLIILMRGLGRLILKINKVQNTAQAKEWADKFKELAQRHVIVIGKDFEYKVEEGMKSGYDYPDTLRTQVNQVSTGTGIPTAFLNGDNEGTLASAKTGQDTTGGQIHAEQQETEDNMTKAYKLFVPVVEPHTWEYDWDHQIEHDEVEKANIVARKVSTAQQMDFLPTGFVFQYLDQDPPEGVDPQMPFAYFLDKLEQENPYAPEDEEIGEPGTGGGKREEGPPPTKKKEGAREQQTTKVELKKPANENAGQAKRAAENPKKEKKAKDEQEMTLVFNADNPPPGFVIGNDGIVLPPKDVFMNLSRGVFGQGSKKTAMVMRELYPDGKAVGNNKINAIEKNDYFKDLEGEKKEEDEENDGR